MLCSVRIWNFSIINLKKKKKPAWRMLGCRNSISLMLHEDLFPLISIISFDSYNSVNDNDVTQFSFVFSTTLKKKYITNKNTFTNSHWIRPFFQFRKIVYHLCDVGLNFYYNLLENFPSRLWNFDENVRIAFKLLPKKKKKGVILKLFMFLSFCRVFRHSVSPSHWQEWTLSILSSNKKLYAQIFPK